MDTTDCKADQDLWVTFTPRWNLTVEGESVVDFLSAPSVLTEDDVVVRVEVQDQDYYIRYAGAAVRMTYDDIVADAAAILNGQYLEVCTHHHH